MNNLNFLKDCWPCMVQKQLFSQFSVNQSWSFCRLIWIFITQIGDLNWSDIKYPIVNSVLSPKPTQKSDILSFLQLILICPSIKKTMQLLLPILIQSGENWACFGQTGHVLERWGMFQRYWVCLGETGHVLERYSSFKINNSAKLSYVICHLHELTKSFSGSAGPVWLQSS